MPCLILTGHPCAGKTRVANLLRERALASQRVDAVVIINEESTCPDHTKAVCYQDAHVEKKTRAALKSAFDRQVASAGAGASASSNKSDSRRPSKRTLVILDSMNYIKGFRYELYCISKAANEQHGVIWVLNDVELCKSWNIQRGTEGASCYTEEQMRELIQRYEPPDARNRWDQPLYHIDMSPSAVPRDVLNQSVYNMHRLSDVIGETATSSQPSCNDVPKPAVPVVRKSAFKRAAARSAATGSSLVQTPPPMTTAAATTTTTTTTTTVSSGSQEPDPPTTKPKEPVVLSLEERVDEILESFFSTVKPLEEGLSTRQRMATDSNCLHMVDAVTQRMCSSIAAAVQQQQQQPKEENSEATTIANDSLLSIGYSNSAAATLQITAGDLGRISVSSLQQFRRQYIKWVQTYPPEDPTERGIAESFLAYLIKER